MNRKRRIGLALGSGSAKGWAHIGVIRALEAMGVRIDVISGTSIGALVGAAYASDQLDRLEAWVRELTWRDVLQTMDISLQGGGFIQGEKLMGIFRRHVEGETMDSLAKPFAAVATDLHTGQEVWLRDGSLLEGVRASIALPGLFTPMEYRGRWLVDGGLVNPVPVSLCRAMGADVVIAVNLNDDILKKRKSQHRQQAGPPAPAKAEADLWEQFSQRVSELVNAQAEKLNLPLIWNHRDAPGLLDVVLGSLYIMQDRLTRSRMAGDPPDITISPRLAHIGLMEFHKADELIEAGRATVARIAPAVRDVLE